MKASLRMVMVLAGVAWALSGSYACAHTDVTVEEAWDLIASTEDLIVVDVREPGEFCDAVGHISGAVNYPWTSGVLQERYEELPLEAPILVVCRSGIRSNQASNFLDSKGFTDVYDMLGGMKAWTWETVPCKYSGGSGTAFAPYQIATAADLIALGETPEDYGKHFILTADIDLDPNLPGGRIFDRAVIAPDTDANERDFQGTVFSGTFAGNGHKILNLTIDAGEGEYLGLFGNVTSTGAIHEVVLEPALVAGRQYVGGLAGCNEGTISDCEVICRLQGQGFAPWKIGGLVAANRGSIERCRVTGEIHTLESSLYVGGVAGWNAGPLSGCHAAVDIFGDTACWDVGGLVGDNRGPITDCHATGNITAGDRLRFAGGLVGMSQAVIITRCSATGHILAGAQSDRLGGMIGGSVSGAVTCSYATGAVTAGDGSWSLGGLAGDNLGTIANCWASGSVSNGDSGWSMGGLIGTNVRLVVNSYSTGAVSGGEDIEYSGALIGRNSGGVEGCFWDMDASGQTTSAGGQGQSTAQMQTLSTFLDAGWDFVDETENGTEDIWWIDEGSDYPRLWWEREEGEPEAVIELSAADFDTQIADGVILVDFYAPWCPACVRQGPILDEVAERLGDRARVAKLDVDQARDIAERYEIWAIPTLIVFYRGLPWVEFVGTTDADTLVAAVLWVVESHR